MHITYDNWIREVIAPDIFDEPPLKKSATKVQETVVPLIDKLFKITKPNHLTLGDSRKGYYDK